MAEIQDFYQILNLNPQDSLEGIRKSLQARYKEALEQQANPDLSEDGDRLYALLKSAFPHFKTAEAREAYDATLKANGSGDSVAEAAPSDAEPVAPVTPATTMEMVAVLVDSPLPAPGEPVEDYYAKLGVEPSISLDTLKQMLEEKRKLARQLAKVTSRREEASQLQELVTPAMVIFKDEASRAAYDARLKESQGKTASSTPASETVAAAVVLPVSEAEPAPELVSEPVTPAPAPDPTPTPPVKTVPKVVDAPPAASSSTAAAVPAPGEPVENYYAKFDVDPSIALEKMKQILEEKRKLSRQLAKVTARREEASQLQELVTPALVIFKDEASRAAYDERLKAYEDSKLAKGMLVDTDYYDLIGVTFVAGIDDINRHLKALEAQPDMAEKVQIIRDTLLDPAKKKEYDRQLAAKKEYDRRKALLKPMPLRMGQLEVPELAGLESVVDANPTEGLEAFLDGEIAGWLEWGLGMRAVASNIRHVADRARTSDAPFVKLDECLRNFNASRPLRLFRAGQKPGDKDIPVIKAPLDLMPYIEKQTGLVVQRFEDIQVWLAQSDQGNVLDQLINAGPEGTSAVQVERLAFAINPSLEVPGYVVQGVENSTIDFGPVGKIGTPSRQFTIQHQGRGYLFGRVATPDDWLKVSVDAFEGPTTTVTVSIDRSKMKAGESYSGKVGIRAIDGRAPNTVIVVTVYMQTAGDILRNIKTSIQSGLKQVRDKLSGLFNKKK